MIGKENAKRATADRAFSRKINPLYGMKIYIYIYNDRVVAHDRIDYYNY